MIEVLSVTKCESELFYKARYSDSANKYSKNQQVPDYADHKKWYMENYKQGFFTVFYNGVPVGYVRINKENIISIGILPDYQRIGIGSEVLKIISRDYNDIRCEIYENNISSIKLFSKFPNIKITILKDLKIDDRA